MRHGPDSEMDVGAPDPLVVNNWRFALADTGTVAPDGQAALPWTPMEMGSAPKAGLTLTIWLPVPLALEFEEEKLTVMIWFPGVVGVQGTDTCALRMGWLPEMLLIVPFTLVVNAAEPWNVMLLGPLITAATSTGRPTVKDPGSFRETAGLLVRT